MGTEALIAIFCICMGFLGGKSIKSAEEAEEKRTEIRQAVKVGVESERQNFTNRMSKVTTELEECKESVQVVSNSTGEAYIIYEKSIWKQQ